MAMKNSICFTGKLNNFTRKSAQETAKANGFEVLTGVKKGLTYLVAADPDSGSSKLCKAEEIGVNIISESDFMKMCNMTPPARTIYDVFTDMGEEISTRDDLLDVVTNTLSEVFECGSGADDLEEKGIIFDDFCKNVTDVLLSGKIEFDESWDNYEVYMMIENTATDILFGNPIGSRANEFAEMLGTNANGQINRTFGVAI